MYPLPLRYVKRSNFHVLNIPGVFEGVFSPDQPKRLASHFFIRSTEFWKEQGGCPYGTYGVHMRFIAHTSITAGMLWTPRMKSAVSYAARLGSEVEPSVCGAFT